MNWRTFARKVLGVGPGYNKGQRRTSSHLTPYNNRQPDPKTTKKVLGDILRLIKKSVVGDALGRSGYLDYSEANFAFVVGRKIVARVILYYSSNGELEEITVQANEKYNTDKLEQVLKEYCESVTIYTDSNP